jgi:hypothetical protein
MSYVGQSKNFKGVNLICAFVILYLGSLCIYRCAEIIADEYATNGICSYLVATDPNDTQESTKDFFSPEHQLSVMTRLGINQYLGCYDIKYQGFVKKQIGELNIALLALFNSGANDITAYNKNPSTKAADKLKVPTDIKMFVDMKADMEKHDQDLYYTIRHRKIVEQMLSLRLKLSPLDRCWIYQPFWDEVREHVCVGGLNYGLGMFSCGLVMCFAALCMATGFIRKEKVIKIKLDKKIQAPSQIGMRYTNYTLRNYLKWIEKEDTEQDWEKEYQA